MKKIFLLILCLFAIDSFASGINAGATTATCDNSTLETYGGTANMEIDWVPNTISLTWRNGDQQVAGPTTCNYDGALNIPTTQPTRTGYTFAGWKLSVPNGYTELEYLESDGGQWINTRIQKYRNGNIYRLASKVSWANVSDRQIHGCQDFFYYGVVNGYLQMTQALSEHTDISMVANTVYDIDATFDTINSRVDFTINGQHYNFANSYGDDVDGKEFAVFSLNDNILSFGPSRVYYYTLYKNGNMMFNGIPARRNSDNVVGMYDTVTQTFFTNAGTGSFTAGPVVQ